MLLNKEAEDSQKNAQILAQKSEFYGGVVRNGLTYGTTLTPQ